MRPRFLAPFYLLAGVLLLTAPLSTGKPHRSLMPCAPRPHP
jgi:hypothetical protein